MYVIKISPSSLGQNIVTINADMESRFATIRQELVLEFASSRENMQTMSRSFTMAESDMTELL